MRLVYDLCQHIFVTVNCLQPVFTLFLNEIDIKCCQSKIRQKYAIIRKAKKVHITCLFYSVPTAY